MKITVDFDHCELHGECVIAAPDVFDIGDDDDVVTLLNDSPGEDQRKAVENAAKMCPVGVIKVEG